MSEPQTSATIPQPREGISGVWDRVVGPGAAHWEIAGTLGFAALGSVAAPLLLKRQRPSAHPLELAVASGVGKDLGGGAWTSETPSSKRWYHRKGFGPLQRIGVASLHVHPFIVEAASGRGQWRSATLSYSSLVAAAALVEAAPPEKRRSVAGGLYSIWLAGSMVIAPPPLGYAWMPTLLGFKVLLGQGTPRGPLSALRRRSRRPLG